MRPDFPFRPAALPFFYGWIVVAVGTLGIAMSIPGQTMGVSVFTDHLIAATGLSRLDISNAYLLGTLVSGLALPFGGRLVDRFGPRRIVVGACLGLGATLVYMASSDRLAAALAATTGIAVTAAAWVVLAAGFTAIRFSGQGMLTLVSRTMIGSWFEQRRGLVSAVSGPFVSFSFASAPLLLSLWIGAAGWRGAWLGLAVLVGLGMGVVGWIFYRDDPEECGLRMDGAAPVDLPDATHGSSAPADTRDFTRAEAMATGAFWLITLGIATQSMVGTGITFHIVDIGAEVGIAERAAVSIFLPVAVASTAVGVAAGLAIDRYPVRYLIAAMMTGEVVMFSCTAHLDDLLLRVCAIAGWGLASGFYGPLTVAALPNFFGRTHLGSIQGMMSMWLVVASALGPSLLAAVKAAFGSYRPGLYALCALPLMVLAASPFIRNPRARSS